MNYCDFGAVVLAVATAALISTDAMASAPRMCSDGDGLRGYNLGRELESRSLRRNFERFFTCGSFESFAAAVRVDLEATSTSDRYLQCRDIGIIHGMNETIREIALNCNLQCSDSGGSIGRRAARQYCGILEIIASPGGFAAMTIATPIPTCNLATQSACRAAFTSTVENDPACNAQANADRSTFRDALDDACKLLR